MYLTSIPRVHAGDAGARYVDAAEYASRRCFVVVVIDAGGSIRAAASTTSSTPEEATNVAIALTIKDPGGRTVLSDSRQAIRNLSRGRVSAAATKILNETTKLLKRARIKWFPTHAREVSDTNANRNETAHARTRELTNRDGSSGDHLWFSTRDRMTSFNEIAKANRLARHALPPPCKGLSREQAVIYTQLQTRTVMSPAFMHKLFPEAHPDGTCRVCRNTPTTLQHIVWDCLNFPEDYTLGRLLPAFEEAKRSDNQDLQLEAVQRVIVALGR